MPRLTTPATKEKREAPKARAYYNRRSPRSLSRDSASARRKRGTIVAAAPNVRSPLGSGRAPLSPNGREPLDLRKSRFGSAAPIVALLDPAFTIPAQRSHHG